MFVKGRKYTRIEVMKNFNENVGNVNSSGYFSMQKNDKTNYLIFCNIGKSKNINGKIFDYENKFIDEKRKIMFWSSKEGDKLTKEKQLYDIYSNPSDVLVFVRESGTEGYQFIGSPTLITLIEEFPDDRPSTFFFDFNSNQDIFERQVNDVAISYLSLLNNISPSKAEEIGLKSEIFVRKILYGETSGIAEVEKKLGCMVDTNSVKWMYLINQKSDHDFEVGKYIIEVKGSSQKNNNRILFSNNEYYLAEKNKNNYFVFVVNNIEDPNPRLEIFSWEEFKDKFEIVKKESFEARR